MERKVNPKSRPEGRPKKGRLRGRNAMIPLKTSIITNKNKTVLIEGRVKRDE